MRINTLTQQKLQTAKNTELPPQIEKIAVLVAEVLSKIRTVLNTMSYSDIINIVSYSASRIFNKKIDGQRVHESIKSTNITSVNTMPPNNLANNQNFTQNG